MIKIDMVVMMRMMSVVRLMVREKTSIEKHCGVGGGA